MALGAAQLALAQQEGMYKGSDMLAEVVNRMRMQQLLGKLADADVQNPQEFRQFARDNNVTMPEANGLVDLMEKQRQAALKQQQYVVGDKGVFNIFSGENINPFDKLIKFGNDNTGLAAEFGTGGYKVLKDPENKIITFGKNSDGLYDASTQTILRPPKEPIGLYRQGKNGEWVETTANSVEDAQAMIKAGWQLGEDIKFDPARGNAPSSLEVFYDMRDGQMHTFPKGKQLSPEEQANYVSEPTYNAYVMAERQGKGDVAREFINKITQTQRSLLDVKDFLKIDKAPDKPTENTIIKNARMQKAALEEDLRIYNTALQNLYGNIKGDIFNKGTQAPAPKGTSFDSRYKTIQEVPLELKQLYHKYRTEGKNPTEAERLALEDWDKK